MASSEDLAFISALSDIEHHRTDQVRAAEDSKVDKFRDALFKELGIDQHPKRELLWAKAWKFAEGDLYDERYFEGCRFEELRAYCCDLAELIK